MGSPYKFTYRMILADVFDGLATLETNSVDFVFADPPYNLSTKGDVMRPEGTGYVSADFSWDKFESVADYETFIYGVLSELGRVLRPTGSLMIMGSFQSIHVTGHALLELGWYLFGEIAWVKTNGRPNFLGTRLQSQHETIIWALPPDRKGRPVYNYQTGKALNGGRQLSSVWAIPIAPKSERVYGDDGKIVHPTQKPEALTDRAIRIATLPGQTVLDPFVGSGTSGVSAIRYGRQFIGIDRDPIYLKTASERIRATQYIGDGFVKDDLKRHLPRVALTELLHAGLLKVGDVLEHDSKSGVVHENGLVTVDLPDGSTFTGSIHQAASALSTKKENGWTYWTYQGKPLDELRWKFWNGGQLPPAKAGGLSLNLERQV